jgi:hypothetical protein
MEVRVTTRKPQDQPEPDNEPAQPVDAEEESDPILELDTLTPKRPQVLIRTPGDREGTLYEMLLPDELGIEEEQELRAELREFSQLISKDKATAADRKKLRARLDHLLRKVLPDAPAEVLAQLNDRKKQRVITNFTGALFAEDATAVDPMMLARAIGVPSIMGS